MLVFDDCFKCTNCGHVYREFRGDIEAYHREKYREQHPTFPTEERRGYCENVLAFFEEHVQKDTDILEVGCGDGFLANIIQSKVESVTGLEIDPELIKRINETYPNLNTVECSFLDYDGGPHDLVYAIDVIEHVEEVQRFVDKLKETTRKYVLIQIPTRRRLKKANPTFDGHCHYFTKESLEFLFDGFTLVKHRLTNKKETARGQSFLALFKKD